MKFKTSAKMLLALTLASALFGCSQKQEETESTIDASKASELLTEKLSGITDNPFITLNQTESGSSLEGEEYSDHKYTSCFYRDGGMVYSLFVGEDQKTCSISCRDLAGSEGIFDISLKNINGDEWEVMDASHYDGKNAGKPGKYVFAAYALRYCFPGIEVLSASGDSIQASEGYDWEESENGLKAVLKDQKAADSFLNDTLQGRTDAKAAVNTESVTFTFKDGKLTAVDSELDAVLKDGDKESPYRYKTSNQIFSASESTYDWSSITGILKSLPEKGAQVNLELPK